MKKIVFIASCPTSHNAFPEIHLSKKNIKKTFRMLYGALKKFPEYKLVVKGRKGWDMNRLPQMIAKQENYGIEFIEDIGPIKLLSDADIVIVNITFMIFDALCLDKSVISIWFKEMEKFTGYKDFKAIKTVYNQKELEKAIKEC